MSTNLNPRFIHKYSTKILNCPSGHPPDYMPVYVKVVLICSFQEKCQRNSHHFRDIRRVGLYFRQLLCGNKADKDVCFASQHGVNCWTLPQHLIYTNRNPRVYIQIVKTVISSGHHCSNIPILSKIG